MKWFVAMVRRSRIERALTATETANLGAMANAVGSVTPDSYAARMLFDYDSATATVTITMDYAVYRGGERELLNLDRRSRVTRSRVRRKMAHDAAIATMLCRAPRRMSVAYAIAV